MWSEIYQKELFLAPNCYKECDGYCCNNFFGKYYNILDKDSVILPMIDEEYEEYKKRGGIKNITEKKYEIKIKDKKFVFYLLGCKEKGLCNPHSNRPFICRVYPYLPKVNIKGEIIGFNYASMMDIFYSSKKTHKCPLVTKDYIQQSIKQNLPKLTPKMIFALILIDEVFKEIKKFIPEYIDKSDIQKFITKFEMLMLSSKVFKNINIEKIYEEVKKEYGEFL